MVYVAVNMEPALTWQTDTDTFLRNNGLGICGNDYTPSSHQMIRNLFAPPNGTNSDPRPVFLAINGLSNSPSHRQWQVLIDDYSNGGSSFDFSPFVPGWRATIDSVLDVVSQASHFIFQRRPLHNVDVSDDVRYSRHEPRRMPGRVVSQNEMVRNLDHPLWAPATFGKRFVVRA